MTCWLTDQLTESLADWQGDWLLGMINGVNKWLEQMTDWLRNWQYGQVTCLVDWVISSCGNHGWSKYSRLALVRARSWVSRPTVDLIRTSWVWIPRSKDFSFPLCGPIIFFLGIKLRGVMRYGKDTSGKKFRKFECTSRRCPLFLEITGKCC